MIWFSIFTPFSVKLDHKTLSRLNIVVFFDEEDEDDELVSGTPSIWSINNCYSRLIRSSSLRAALSSGVSSAYYSSSEEFSSLASAPIASKNAFFGYIERLPLTGVVMLLSLFSFISSVRRYFSSLRSADCLLI